jgi:hypothetical protein
MIAINTRSPSILVMVIANDALGHKPGIPILKINGGSQQQSLNIMSK